MLRTEYVELDMAVPRGAESRLCKVFTQVPMYIWIDVMLPTGTWCKYLGEYLGT